MFAKFSERIAPVEKLSADGRQMSPSGQPSTRVGERQQIDRQATTGLQQASDRRRTGFPPRLCRQKSPEIATRFEFNAIGWQTIDTRRPQITVTN